MSLSCVISTDTGRDGKIVTATVREHLVDDQKRYASVLKHIEICGKCDPLEVLEVYLERRRSMEKFEGKTSNGLMGLAMRYERLFKERDRYGEKEKSVVNEFIWRSGAIAIAENAERLSSKEIYDGFSLSKGLKTVASPKKTIAIKFILSLVQQGIGKEWSSKELDDYVKAAIVMNS